MNASQNNHQQRIEDCRELYLKFGGEQHELIEREMRELGYHDFHRRSLYRRFERGTCKEGWIGKYGWEKLLTTVPGGFYSTAESLGRGDGGNAVDGKAGTLAFLEAKTSNPHGGIHTSAVHAGGTRVPGKRD